MQYNITSVRIAASRAYFACSYLRSIFCAVGLQYEGAEIGEMKAEPTWTDAGHSKVPDCHIHAAWSSQLSGSGPSVGRVAGNERTGQCNVVIKLQQQRELVSDATDSQRERERERPRRSGWDDADV